MKIEVNQEVLKKWGVYKITNNINGKIYIGSTIESFKKRLSKHISSFYCWNLSIIDRCDCPILYNSFKKYGIENFSFSILYFFNKKKDSKKCKEIATYLEERAMKKLKPEYNICKIPTLSGCPNLGRKLSEEWKKKIGEKSKLYKHRRNSKIYQSKIKQNKELSCLYRVDKDGKQFIGSVIECCNFLSISNTKFFSNSINKTKIKSQMKSIRIYNDNNFSKEFESFGKCDKFLGMWRGFTSTQVVNNKDKILDFKYELL